MELDDFKTVWKDAAGPALYGTEELRKLMLQDGDNPIFLLKRKFRKGMRLMIILFVIITTQFLRGGHPFHHALFWFYNGFSVVMLSYFAFSYRLAGRMMSTYKPVKAQLESQFRLLEKIFLWRKLFTRLIPVIFIGMLEFMTYQTNDPGLKNWSLHPVSQRVAYYVVAYLIFYTITYLAFRSRYARHLECLKSLIRELN